VVDGERDVGVERLADRLAVIDGLGVGEQLEVGLEAVGDLEQDVGARGGVGLAPLGEGGMRGVERELDVLGGGARGLGVVLAVDRRDHVEILTLDRRHPLAADEVVVAGLELDLGIGLAGHCIQHGVVSSSFDGCGRVATGFVQQGPCQQGELLYFRHLQGSFGAVVVQKIGWSSARAAPHAPLIRHLWSSPGSGSEEQDDLLLEQAEP